MTDGYTPLVRFSPDGRHLAYSRGGSLLVADATTGKIVHKLQSASGVQSAAFSPEGGWVAAGAKDGTVRVMSLLTGEVKTKFRFAREVPGVTFSPDGRWLAIAADSLGVHIAEPSSPQENALLSGFPLADGSLPTSSDGRYIVSTSPGLQVLETTDGSQVLVDDSRGDEGILAAEFHPENTKLTGMTSMGTLINIDITAGTMERKIVSDTPIKAANFRMDGGLVALITNTDELKVLNARTGGQEDPVKPGWPGVAARFSPDGTRLMMGYESGKVRLLEPGTGKTIWEKQLKIKLADGSFQAAGRWLQMSRNTASHVYLDAGTGEAIELPGNSDQISLMGITGDGLLYGKENALSSGTVVMLDPKEDREIFRKTLPSFVAAMAVSGDSRLVAALGGDGICHVMNRTSGKQVCRINLVAGPVEAPRHQPGHLLGSCEEASTKPCNLASAPPPDYSAPSPGYTDREGPPPEPCRTRTAIAHPATRQPAHRRSLRKDLLRLHSDGPSCRKPTRPAAQATHSPGGTA